MLAEATLLVLVGRVLPTAPLISSIYSLHGGRLWASPNAGPGATFQFTLPLPSARQS